jgi:hypothetical protein
MFEVVSFSLLSSDGLENFKGLSQDAGRAAFTENLRASAFNEESSLKAEARRFSEDPSNDTNFSQNYLD